MTDTLLRCNMKKQKKPIGPGRNTATIKGRKKQKQGGKRDY